MTLKRYSIPNQEKFLSGYGRSVPTMNGEMLKSSSCLYVGINEIPYAEGLPPSLIGHRVSISIQFGKQVGVAMLDREEIEWLRQEIDKAEDAIAQAAIQANIGRRP